LKIYNFEQLKKKSMALKRVKPTDSKECIRIKKALPHGGITKISELTGLEQQLVQRTMKGEISRWDKRHNLVIRTAKELIEKVAIK